MIDIYKLQCLGYLMIYYKLLQIDIIDFILTFCLLFYRKFIYLLPQQYIKQSTNRNQMITDFIRINQQQLTPKKLQKLLFSFGAITFSLATLSTLPILNQKTSMFLYVFLIRISILLLSISQIISLKFGNLSKIHFSITILIIIGYCLYLLSSFIHPDFNKGSLYIVAAFFVCFALEIKIFVLVASKEINVKRILKNDRNLIMHIGFQLLAHLFHLFGTVLQQIQLPDMSFLPGTTNLIGGISLLAAISTYFSQSLYGNSKHEYKKLRSNDSK